ncbi:DAK2 domain-containing protein [Metabacillus sp. GX 13764]|uniref:DAK2 domain-containing protein n=1 Tax=Metabacillus kandeliae TaxID=2900151 RepID=UPI001E3A5E28|nr:DAK2 domain-containing protein [Metabacillus kandeliae]MCD7033820.1 DAK2 domain-containing protein [Metabacillus kandeliae]
MSITTIDGKRFAQMVSQGASLLSVNAKVVDALNVFPVPDGDTGTNMNLSMTSGAKEVQTNTQAHIGKVGIALSRGLLMGARGNSGVILSQLFRGFAKSIETKETIGAEEFAKAFQAGVDTAYKAVMKPVEGTILTVAKDAAKKAVEAAKTETDLVKVMTAVVEEAHASLNRTPDLLPVLKEVGVVDSGGQGLVYVYEGFLAELKGEKVAGTPSVPPMSELVNAEHHKNAQSHMNTEDIEYGYCTEFMVRFEEGKQPFSEENFRQELSKHGDSLLVVSDDDLVKVHIHAEYPGDVLSYGQKYGSLINMKIENMRQQHTSLVGESRSKQGEPKKEKQKYGVIAVSMGQGIAELFKSIGVDEVIEGGQTMNPSTEDIVSSIKSVNADHVIILPNNSNIVMAANQAASVVENNVIVIPSKTVPQGMAAMLAFNPEDDAEQTEKALNEALKHVKSGQITYAVRDTQIDGLDIAKNDFMGISDGKIVTKGSTQIEAARNLLDLMMSDEDEILTILCGEDAKQDETDELAAYIEEKFPDAELEIHRGDQPLYSYIFSIE